MEVYEVQLTEVVRQMHDSGILWNATELRRYISAEDFLTLPSVRVEGFPDIRMVSGSELIEVINDCYGQAGMDETIVVCRSNKRTNIYNKGIRNTILFREDELNSGDLLMVAKNNYFWTEGCKEIDFIANGDIAVIRRVRRMREAYGFRFADVVLAFPDYDGMELEVKLLLDTLHTETPALPKELNDKLFYSVLEDYADITVKRERMKKIESRSSLQCLTGEICVCRYLSQSAGWPVETGLFGSGLYDGEYADSGLFPLAVYGFHPCYGNSVSSELAEGADGISRQSVRC